MLLLPCVGAVPLMHSPALTQPLVEASVVVVGEQLPQATARQLHCLPLHTPTHLPRVVTAAMPVIHELMRTPLQVLELKLLTYPEAWS